MIRYVNVLYLQYLLLVWVVVWVWQELRVRRHGWRVGWRSSNILGLWKGVGRRDRDILRWIWKGRWWWWRDG